MLICTYCKEKGTFPNRIKCRLLLEPFWMNFVSFWHNISSTKIAMVMFIFMSYSDGVSETIVGVSVFDWVKLYEILVYCGFFLKFY